MPNSDNRPAPALPFLFGLMLGAAAIAQNATVSTFTPACQPPFGQRCTITATPPVIGTTATITTRGPHQSYAMLLLSLGANHQGWDLTPYGSPGCRLYAAPNLGVVVPQSLFSGVRSYSLSIPSGFPIGVQLFAQALLTNGGPATPSVLTSNWEHVTVWVSSGQVVGCFFSAHYNGAYHTAPNMTFAGGRPVVYVAKGSHAAYPVPGTYHYGADHCADGGVQWDVSFLLDRLEAQPWKDFAGAWGEVGSLSETTGPLGSWHKRFNP